MSSGLIVLVVVDVADVVVVAIDICFRDRIIKNFNLFLEFILFSYLLLFDLGDIVPGLAPALFDDVDDVLLTSTNG